ncbi:MAG: hypothetical protein JXB42_05790, partial [Deltaproteobacteria bacterium]|nr:hypothetical protein [Deltaproteobacteria bacterium]
VPLDHSGMVTFFAFVDGMAPYKQVFVTPSASQETDVSMSRAGSESPTMTVTAELTPNTDGWVRIRGSVKWIDLPVCAMILANGQYTFSDADDGRFEIVVPPAGEDGSITLFGFADGFSPYKAFLPTIKAETVASYTSYGSVILVGTVSTITLKSVCASYWPKPSGCIMVPQETPVSVLVDANGSQTVSSSEDGGFELEVLPDADGRITISSFMDEYFSYAEILSPEEIIPWIYLSVNPSELTMLTDTTEIAQIVGGKAPYDISSSNTSLVTASLQGTTLTIKGLTEGFATVVIADSESHSVNVDVAVVSEGTGETIWVPVREERDMDKDGSIDTVTYYTYSSHGLIKEEGDLDNNGTMEWVICYTCDGDGRHCTKSYDSTNDGIFEYTQYLTYDDIGNILEILDGMSAINLTYTPEGKAATYEIDHGNDRIADYIEYYDYNVQGHKSREESDEGNDGIIDHVHTYHYLYDCAGNPTRYESDYSNDGIIDSVSFFVYHADGTLSKFEKDIDNDGQIDRTVSFDADGRMDQIETSSELIHIQWERRNFDMPLNIPDPTKQWL